MTEPAQAGMPATGAAAALRQSGQPGRYEHPG